MDGHVRELTGEIVGGSDVIGGRKYGSHGNLGKLDQSYSHHQIGNECHGNNHHRYHDEIAHINNLFSMISQDDAKIFQMQREIVQLTCQVERFQTKLQFPEARLFQLSAKRTHRQLSPAPQVRAGRVQGVTMNRQALLDDLTHLAGPLTEDSILRTLQARFESRIYQTRIGPVVLSLNPVTQIPGPTALCGPYTTEPSRELQSLVRDVLSQHSDTNQSQAIVTGGESGSGKTFSCMQMLHQLFVKAGGGPDTDTFKHLSAALTVLLSMSSASTLSNRESSRLGYFIQNFILDGAIYRTKIQCYFLDQVRTTSVLPQEKNFHIFYQMMTGLTKAEKVKFHLEGYTVSDLSYLNRGRSEENSSTDRLRFHSWKASLAMLGIPFSDVMRILSALLLLGNVDFVQGDGYELDITGQFEFRAVAALLGVSGVGLYQGLTTKTRNIRGQMYKSLANATTANWTKDLLARCLYTRTLAAIVKRANTSRCHMTTSSDSTDSSDNSLGINNADLSSMSPCKPPNEPVSDGFIGILDLFGFEVAQVNQFEQLCINLCSEIVQQFYTQFIFKSPLEACQEEGLHTDVDVFYIDNSPVIDLISAPKTGLFSILDAESRESYLAADAFVDKFHRIHKQNDRYFEAQKSRTAFGISHFGGRVVYDAQSMLRTNRDFLSDDVICVFSKENCNFGFAAHLFSSEMKPIHDGSESGPKGLSHRILPRQSESTRQVGKLGNLSGDFCDRIDRLLRVLQHTRPHFVRCIKCNDRGEKTLFDKTAVVRQIRSLQVLETVKLMAGGLPHRVRYKHFTSRYNIFLRRKQFTSTDNPLLECKLILSSFLLAVDQGRLPYVSVQWALGKKCIFLSEGARQQLEAVRGELLDRSATIIQSLWRGHICRRRWRGLGLNPRLIKGRQPAPIATVPPRPAPRNRPSLDEKKFPQHIQNTCKQLGLDTDTPPPVPRRRNYTVTGDVKLFYPQLRVITQRYQENGLGPVLYRGEEVKAVGPSHKRGFLVVHHDNTVLHVPYQVLKLKAADTSFELDV